MSAAQVMQWLYELAWPLVTAFLLIVVGTLARFAAGLVCATVACRWIRARDDLPEDKRQELITDAIRRYLHLRNPPSQPAASQVTAGSDDTGVI